MSRRFGSFSTALAGVIVLLCGIWVYDTLQVHAQQAQSASLVQQTATMANAATKIANAQAAVGSASTATMTPAGSNSVYITAISFDACQDGTGGTAVSNGTFTSTNITGSPVWQFSLVSTANTCIPPKVITFATPLKSTTPGTATTLVSPSTAHVQYTINASWYEAP